MSVTFVNIRILYNSIIVNYQFFIENNFRVFEWIKREQYVPQLHEIVWESPTRRYIFNVTDSKAMTRLVTYRKPLVYGHSIQRKYMLTRQSPVQISERTTKRYWNPLPKTGFQWCFHMSSAPSPIWICYFKVWCQRRIKAVSGAWIPCVLWSGRIHPWCW